MALVVGGKSTTPQKAALMWVGALRPAEEERGRLVRSFDSEPVAVTGAKAVASLPVDGEASGADKMHGKGPLYSCVGGGGGGWMGWTGWLSLVSSHSDAPCQ
jgi:hypothetical protein